MKSLLGPIPLRLLNKQDVTKNAIALEEPLDNDIQIGMKHEISSGCLARSGAACFWKLSSLWRRVIVCP
jgi:hypothetical protein